MILKNNSGIIPSASENQKSWKHRFLTCF